MSTQRVHAASDVLSEPSVGSFLRVLRRELSLTLAPDLQSERSRDVAGLMQLVLDHMIARQEILPELEAAFAGTQYEARTALSAGSAGLLSDGDVAQLVRQASLVDNSTARTALHRVLAAERELHDALERREREVAASTTVCSEQPALESARLQTYLRQRFGSDVEVTDIRTPMGGYSKDTFIVSLRGANRPADGIVIRCDLPGGPLETTATSELAVLQAMHAAGVPVAEPLWAETNAAAVGRPFIAVRQASGKQPMSMKLDFTGDDAPGFARQLAAVLARVHQVDPRGVGVDTAILAMPTTEHVIALLDQFEEQWRRRRQGPSPTIAAGLEWMRHNIPRELPSVRVVHGDATLRNMLFDGGQVTALLDWETWHLGDPGEDLAYCRDEVQRFMPWDEFLSAYYAAGGPHFSEESQRYWGMWLYLRGAITSVSQMDRLLDEPPPDIRPAFGGPHFTRYCVRRVADYLLAV